MNATQFSSTTRFSPTCKRRLLKTSAQAAASFLVLLLTIGLIGVPASAQPATADRPDRAGATTSEAVPSVWKENFDEQIARQLRRQPSRRASFIQVVIAQASESGLPKGKDLTLRRTAEALLHIVETDSNRDHRLMAIQALSLIGSQHLAASQQKEIADHLYTLAQEESSEKVRESIAGVISSYQAG